MARKVILYEAVLSLRDSLTRKRETTRTLSIVVSIIVNPFSVTAKINDKVVVLLVDTGLALTILHRNI